MQSRPKPSSGPSVERWGCDGRPVAWTVNDLRDIDALSIAVPYCDVVVTDHTARTAIIHAHLDWRCSTIVTRWRQELLQTLPPGAHTSKPSDS